MLPLWGLEFNLENYRTLNGQLITEIKIYSRITGATDALPRAKMVINASTISNCCCHVSLILNDLNLSENMGMGETSNADNTKTITIIAVEEEVKTSNQAPKGLFNPSTKPTIKIAFAGVGSPINELVC
jgi:hypothetical protein